MRVAVVALAVVALLTIVSYASRDASSRHTTQQPAPAYLSYALTLFLILFVLAVPVAVWAFLQQARELGGQEKSFRARVTSGLLKVAVVCLLGFVFVYLKRHHQGIFSPSFHNLASTGGSRRTGQHVTPYQPHFEWLVLWLSIGVTAVALAAAYVIRRRRTTLETETSELPATIEAALAGSIDEALDDLEAEPDARKAVVAAYARMEAVLARRGMHRRASETPVEYMRRILLGLNVGHAPIERLTALFELAKFSRRDIDGSMKHDAIGALREIRDDLLGAIA